MPGTPSEWAQRQREFHHRFAAQRSEIPGVPVHWRATPASSVVAAKRIAFPLLSEDDASFVRVVSIWPLDAPVDTPATLIFEIGPHPALADEGDGVLFGEFDLNGAVCLEVATNEVLWPTYNPRPPAFRPQRR